MNILHKYKIYTNPLYRISEINQVPWSEKKRKSADYPQISSFFFFCAEAIHPKRCFNCTILETGSLISIIFPIDFLL